MNQQHQHTEELVNGYRRLDVLGSGGYATVYKVSKVEGNVDSYFALKLLSAEKSQEEAALAQFRKEINLLSSISSSGIVSVLDSGVFNSRPYFVMEYCSGGTLEQRLYELWPREVTIDDAKELGFSIARALWPAHARVPAIAHCDIKPQNLLIRTGTDSRPGRPLGFLEPSEELIVGDFGLARYVNLETTSKESIGGFTRGFAPLEQVRGDVYLDVTADVYSSSAVVAAALLDVRPRQVFSEQESAFSEEDLARCGVLESVLRKGLSNDPLARHANIREWFKELDAAASKQPTHHQVHPGDGVGDLHDRKTVEREGPNASPETGRSEVVTSHVSPDGQKDRERAGREPSFLNRYGFLLGLLGGVIVASGVMYLLSRPETGTGLIGPATGAVGDAAVFTLDDQSLSTWKIEGVEAAYLSPDAWVVGPPDDNPEILNVTPLSPGRYELEAVASNGDSLVELMFVVADEGSAIGDIVGADYLKVGTETRLRLQGVKAGSEIDWLIDGEEAAGYAVALTPKDAGTVVVVARTAGQEVTRTFTVVE